MTLFRKELGRTLRSIIFLLTAVGIVLFAYSQGVFPTPTTITAPQPGMADYGTKPSNDPARIMPEAAESLHSQYAANAYTTYPNGFLKYVKLNQADRERMAAILSALSGEGLPAESAQVPAPQEQSIEISGDALQAIGDGEFMITVPETSQASTHFTLDPSITWEQFSALMAEADALLGGGSDFSTTWIGHRFGTVPITYEEASADHARVLADDRMTGAHARLFSDYTGIIMGLLPVFPAVFLCLQDRRNIAPQLYVRRTSSLRLILSRYAALLLAVMLPVLLMGAILTGIHGATYGWQQIDAWAYLKYALGWILPTAMAATAVGMFFTTLTRTPIGIAVQLIWWFADMMGGSSAYSFFGVSTLQLIPRHNALGNTTAYLEYLPDLVRNRIWIACIAIALLVLTAVAYDCRRRGLLDVSIQKHRKGEPAL